MTTIRNSSGGKKWCKKPEKLFCHTETFEATKILPASWAVTSRCHCSLTNRDHHTMAITECNCSIGRSHLVAFSVMLADDSVCHAT